MKKFFSTLVIVCMLIGLSTNYTQSVFASDIEKEASLPEENQFADAEHLQFDSFEEDSFVNDDVEDIVPASHITYIIKNKRYTGESFGSVKARSNEGVPGVTIGINGSVGISAECSVSNNINLIKALNATFGFSVIGTYTVGTSESWTVPKYYNGRAVKYAYLIARPVYDHYAYSVYIKSNKIKETFLTNGTCKKPKYRMRGEPVVVYK